MKNKDKRYCHLCGSVEIKGGWCSNQTCSEYRRYSSDINDAEHPLRQKAIRILETIAEELGKPKIFDCRKGDEDRWYRFEDLVVRILNKKEKGYHWAVKNGKVVKESNEEFWRKIKEKTK